MLAKLRTFSLVGIEALPVEVEVDVSPGALPKTVLVGLPEAAVKESTHRVERAMVNSGFLRPARSHRHQPGPGRSAQAGRVVRSADHAGHSGRQRADRLGAVRAIRRGRRTGARRQHAADQRCAVDGHRRRPRARAEGAGRADGQRGRGGGRRRDRSDRRLQPGAGRGILHRRDRDRAHARAARTNGSPSSPTTTSTSPTSAARRWPSGRSPSPPPESTIC